LKIADYLLKMCKEKVVQALNHYNIKIEVLEDLIHRTNTEPISFPNVITCSLLVQEKMILEEFTKLLEEIIN